MSCTKTVKSSETQDRPFGPVHIVEPKSEHTHTAVLLHGRGSTGEEFAKEFFESTLSDGYSLFEKLSGCRWVFPSSPEIWSTVFQEVMPAWFDAHSLTDINARQDLQVNGINDSVNYVTAIVNEETGRLKGSTKNLLLGGISQGSAVALWTLLCQQDATKRPGAVMVTNTWLPFAANIKKALEEQPGPNKTQETGFNAFMEQMIAPKTFAGMTEIVRDYSKLPSVFIGHGVDDAYVDVKLGQQARGILTEVGFSVEWHEYSGAEEEGHWFKIPDEMDDIHSFLGRIGWTG